MKHSETVGAIAPSTYLCEHCVLIWRVHPGKRAILRAQRGRAVQIRPHGSFTSLHELQFAGVHASADVSVVALLVAVSTWRREPTQ